MNTQAIQVLIDKYQLAYEEAQQEADNCKVLLEHWKAQLVVDRGVTEVEHKTHTVHHTYTDTPMAEEYYGGWTVGFT